MVTRHSYRCLVFLLLLILAVLFIAPILIVLMNSFKGQFSISGEPFRLPTKETFVGLLNYRNGIEKIDFVSAFAYSLFITVASVSVIILFTSMAAWYIVRRKSFFTKFFYLTLVFSMIVPFQMVMFTMSKIANVLNLENPVGIVLIYLGFGAGLSVFIFSGFVRSLPYALEEAASIDGCNPWQMFFKIIFPMMKPTAVTVAILNAMWLWNDYLLPYLVIGSKYKTIPVAIQYLQGGYGSRDMGALMAMLVLAVLPIIVFYAFAQKFIVKGVIAGAVKG